MLNADTCEDNLAGIHDIATNVDTLSDGLLKHERVIERVRDSESERELECMCVR